MTFEKFENGSLFFPDRTVCLADIMWEEHPAFQGVALKHFLTSADSGGAFSYHLVRIAPGCEIGQHVHAQQLETHEVIAGSGVCICDGREMPYESGAMAVLPAGVPHKVSAGADGLYLFAKFIPALC